MIRQKLLSIGGPVLAAMAILLMATSGYAQRGGGYYGGGYHGGGYYGGGYYGGGYRGGYYGGWGNGYGYYPGYQVGSGYYSGYNASGASYYPSYPSYSYSPGYYNAVPPVVASPTYQSFYPPAAPANATSNTVHLTVQVPADATVWIDGQATQQTGESREFVSPALTPGKEYSYDIRVRWTQDGQAVEQSKNVKFHAGEQVSVNFLKS